MLGFEITFYALGEDDTREYIGSASIGPVSLLPREGRALGLYRVERETGYPTEMVTSFGYLEESLKKFPARELKRFHKDEAWNRVEPGTLIHITEWDQS